MRYLAIVSYLGTNYIGWQAQSNQQGVENVIENILSRVLNSPINIIGAGRTDKGVHAYAQSFHFDVDNPIKNLSRFIYSINRLLPIDIRIKSIKKVVSDFHARFFAKRKEYLYKIYTGKMIPFYYSSHMIAYLPININAMRAAAKFFIGKHNFQNLTSKEVDDKNFIRIIDSIKIQKHNDEILITLKGNSFMRYMVRNIVGEMVEVATNRKKISDLNSLFSDVRKITNHKAPPEGLYLKRVIY